MLGSVEGSVWSPIYLSLWFCRLKVILSCCASFTTRYPIQLISSFRLQFAISLSETPETKGKITLSNLKKSLSLLVGTQTNA